MRLRTGNRRRRRAHSIAEGKRIHKQRLDKLWRLTRRALIKAVVEHYEDLILNGSGNFASGGIVDLSRVAAMPRPRSEYVAFDRAAFTGHNP